MSSQEDLSDAPDPPNGNLFKPKKKPKAIRVLTVMAYVLSVSMAAILLSIYYIFMWKGEHHNGASGQAGDPEYLKQDFNDNSFRYMNTTNLTEADINASVTKHVLEVLSTTHSYVAGASTTRSIIPGNATTNQNDGKPTSSSDNTIDNQTTTDHHYRNHDLV